MAQKSHNPNYDINSCLNHLTRVEETHKFAPTNIDEVLKLLKDLEPNKAPGSDNISSYIIKKTQDTIAPKLVKLFNLYIERDIFPDPLKIARVIPLHKGGLKSDPTNYRPISLLPQFGKLFEKIIKKQLASFFDRNNLITDHQFGFRESHSTELAITTIQNDLLQNLDNNEITCAVFLDLAKAFDSVDHEILLKKLEIYGIRGSALQLMKSYLSNRTHVTRYDGIDSELLTLLIGVPQGSILGPLLFLVFINDLPTITKFGVKLFADDTFLSMKGSDLKTLERNANNEMKKISKWFAANKLTLNVAKSKFMIIKRQRSNEHVNFILKYNGKKMERCSSYKYLGIQLDENLNWKPHISFLCEKLSKLSGLFAKLRHCCGKDLLKTIYHALVESHLQYCNIIWGHVSENILDPLIKLQDKIIRIMCFIPNHDTNMDPVYRELELLDVKKLNKLATAKFMFKFKNKKLPKSFDNFFRVSDEHHRYPLRNRIRNDYTCEWGKTTYAMKRLQYEGVQLWNSLLPDIRNIVGIKEFSKQYKGMLLT